MIIRHLLDIIRHLPTGTYQKQKNHAKAASGVRTNNVRISDHRRCSGVELFVLVRGEGEQHPRGQPSLQISHIHHKQVRHGHFKLFRCHSCRLHSVIADSLVVCFAFSSSLIHSKLVGGADISLPFCLEQQQENNSLARLLASCRQWSVVPAHRPLSTS